jgi:hypothetical protein
MQFIEATESHAARIRRKVKVTFNHMSTTWPTLFLPYLETSIKIHEHTQTTTAMQIYRNSIVSGFM